MTILEIDKAIENNRDEINNYLLSELPLDIIYFNVRILAARNEELIKKYNELRHEKLLNPCTQ